MNAFDEMCKIIRDADRDAMAADFAPLGRRDVYVIGHDPGARGPADVVAAVDRERGIITVVSGPPVIEDHSGAWWPGKTRGTKTVIGRRAHRAARRARMTRKRRRGFA